MFLLRMQINLRTGKLLFALLIVVVAASCTSSYNVVKYQYQNFTIDQKTDSVKDETYLNLLKPYSARLDSELTEVIAFADTSLLYYRPESPLSNFISDILLDYGYEYTGKKYRDIAVDFSLTNINGLRTSLPAGEIRVSNIFELLPFENELVLLKLTGDQVAGLSDYIVFRKGEGVAGISFGMKSGKAVDIKIRNKPLDRNATYWLITYDYIANGGDGMKILKDVIKRVETGDKIRDVVIRKLKQMKYNGQHVTAKIDGRIYYVE
jgi:2',3'-cyclic-nucleotide 2'-phosphodiesterase (5'-nucleotidase family)